MVYELSQRAKQNQVVSQGICILLDSRNGLDDPEQNSEPGTNKSMGGRFGKYGDAKRKAQIRKTRLRPPDHLQRTKDKPLRGLHRRRKRKRVTS